MATQRYISTSFWTDMWIRKLDPSERYLYLYLLTNPQTNIAGVYQITLDRIAFDTGYDERTVRPILDRFAKANKAHLFEDEWIVIPSWPKHQRIKKRDNNRKGIDAILMDLPDNVYSFLYTCGYEYIYLGELQRPLEAPSSPLQDPYKPHARESNYSDSDSDSDTDTDTNWSTPTAEADASRVSEESAQVSLNTGKPTNALKDPIAAMWEHALTEMQPSSTWGNYAKERAQCKQLAQRTADLMTQTVYNEPEELITVVMAEYDRLKRTNKSDFWKTAAWTPSQLISHWSAIWTSLQERHAVEEALVF